MPFMVSSSSRRQPPEHPRPGRPADPAQAAAVGRQVAPASTCPCRGLVHRDVKPANLLFDEHGTARWPTSAWPGRWPRPADGAGRRRARHRPLRRPEQVRGLSTPARRLLAGPRPGGGGVRCRPVRRRHLAGHAPGPGRAPPRGTARAGALAPSSNGPARRPRRPLPTPAPSPPPWRGRGGDARPDPIPLPGPGITDFDPHPTEIAAPAAPVAGPLGPCRRRSPPSRDRVAARAARPLPSALQSELPDRPPPVRPAALGHPGHDTPSPPGSGRAGPPSTAPATAGAAATGRRTAAGRGGRPGGGRNGWCRSSCWSCCSWPRGRPPSPPPRPPGPGPWCRTWSHERNGRPRRRQASRRRRAGPHGPVRRPAGTVIGQDPAPGTLLAAHHSVSLRLSAGPPPVDLPGVSGRPRRRPGRPRRAGAGFVVTTEHRTDEDVPAGAVVEQRPSAGKASPGSEIRLVISDGRSRRGPQRRRQGLRRRRQGLTAKRFKVTRSDEFSDTVPAGRSSGTRRPRAEAPGTRRSRCGQQGARRRHGRQLPGRDGRGRRCRARERRPPGRRRRLPPRQAVKEQDPTCAERSCTVTDGDALPGSPGAPRRRMSGVLAP